MWYACNELTKRILKARFLETFEEALINYQFNFVKFHLRERGVPRRTFSHRGLSFLALLNSCITHHARLCKTLLPMSNHRVLFSKLMWRQHEAVIYELKFARHMVARHSKIVTVQQHGWLHHLVCRDSPHRLLHAFHKGRFKPKLQDIALCSNLISSSGSRTARCWV